MVKVGDGEARKGADWFQGSGKWRRQGRGGTRVMEGE